MNLLNLMENWVVVDDMGDAPQEPTAAAVNTVYIYLSNTVHCDKEKSKSLWVVPTSLHQRKLNHWTKFFILNLGPRIFYTELLSRWIHLNCCTNMFYLILGP